MNFVYLWKKTTPAELGLALVLACFAQMFVGKSKSRIEHTHRLPRARMHPEYCFTMT